MKPDPFDSYDFQRMNASIRPDGWLVEKTKAAMKRGAVSASPNRAARRRAVSLAACAAVLGLCLLPGGKTSAPPPTPASSLVFRSPAPDSFGFTLKLHMAQGADGRSPNLMESEQIREGTAFRWGKLRVTRSKQIYTNPTNGDKYYGVRSEGFSPFLSLEGDDIATVQATTEHGSVMFMTESYYENLERAGLGKAEELFTFSVPFTDQEAFSSYWESEACAAWRQKAQGLHPVMRAGEGLCFQFTDITENSMTAHVKVAWRSPHSPEIIDYARDGKIRYMNWQVNGKLFDEFARYPAIPYEDITADTLTITVTFTDGRTQTQSIRLSFDEEGYVIARLVG